MPHRRIERLNEQIKRELTDILRQKVRDPRLGVVTVTDVQTTPDLDHARVYLAALGDEAEKQRSLEGARAAAAYVRSELGRRLHIRRVPELMFELDRSLEHAMRIERILSEVLPEDEAESGDDTHDA